MARLVVYNSDMNKGREHRPQRGDVIDILPDGADPGRAVLGSDQFLVLDVDGDAADFAGLCEAVRDGDEKLMRYRAKKIDIDSMLAAAQVKTGSAIDQKVAVKLDTADLLNKASLKPALADPRIIG